MTGARPIRQVAFFVEDVRSAARAQALIDFYAMVAQAARDYRGTDPIHTIRMT